MSAHLLERQDISGLESILLDGVVLKPAPYSELARFTQNQLSLFCLAHGVYQIPVCELIDFLKSEIGEMEALEIGAGNGVIGRSLGIRATDSHMQDDPAISALYASAGQPTVMYGKDVEKIDAVSAVAKYEPECVVGCWVTHKWTARIGSGNYFGIDESAFKRLGVSKYIHVGNDSVHGMKPLLKSGARIRKLKFPWILSRSMNPDGNVIYIFEGNDYCVYTI